ncbi:MAG: DUF4330 domain-containing protein [Defluviitaleaceae bacterium]|nr:DUF4330 domain-containing protein [Defluviitaleaceae bacterium]
MFKDSKLFGKINIIDLVLIIGLVGAAIFGGYQFRRGESIIAPTETHMFYVSFFAEEVEGFTAEVLRGNAGVNVFDHSRGVFLGTLESYDIQPAIIWNADHAGNTVQSDKPGFNSVTLTARIEAVSSEHGFLVAGNRYGVGHSLAVRAGGAHIFVRVSGLEKI